MNLDDPAQLRSELARLYRSLEDKEADFNKLKRVNEKLKANAAINAASDVTAKTTAVSCWLWPNLIV